MTPAYISNISKGKLGTSGSSGRLNFICISVYIYTYICTHTYLANTSRITADQRKGDNATLLVSPRENGRIWKDKRKKERGEIVKKNIRVHTSLCCDPSAPRIIRLRIVFFSIFSTCIDRAYFSLPGYIFISFSMFHLFIHHYLFAVLMHSFRREKHSCVD